MREFNICIATIAKLIELLFLIALAIVFTKRFQEFLIHHRAMLEDGDSVCNAMSARISATNCFESA